ncbi:MAG: hypothetical protein U5N86_03425 [Planctomycetota bacterium]|nr:hypothetical protein [Planctomycetota bacterium]
MDFLKHFYAYKGARVNYSLASRAINDFEDADPDHKLRIWAKEGMRDIKRKVNLYTIRHSVYKELGESILSIAEDTGKREDYELAADVLDYLFRYYRDTKYLEQAATAFRKSEQFDEAAVIYGRLIGMNQGTPDEARIRYLAALNYHLHAQTLEGNEKKNALTNAKNQLAYVKVAFESLFNENKKWQELLSKIERALEAM